MPPGVFSFLLNEGTIWAFIVALLLGALGIVWRSREKDRERFEEKIDKLTQKHFDSELKLQILTDASIRRDEKLLEALAKRGSR